MDIVDFHAHFFSRPFFETLAALSPRAGDVEQKLAAIAERTGLEIPDRDVRKHTARWLAELDNAGASHMVAFASLPEEAASVAAAVEAAQGRLTGCVLFNPCQPNALGRLQHHLDDQHFAGVLLFPAMHHFRLDDPEHEPVLELLHRRRAIVFVHCGLLVVRLRDMLELPRPYDLSYANPLHVIPAANRARRAKFVIPHFGAGFFRETLMAGTQCDNIFVDTSSSNDWTRTQPVPLTLRDVFARTLDVFGPDRVLFGTDSATFPTGWRQDRLAEQRAILDGLGVDAAGILGGNARRLLGHMAT